MEMSESVIIPFSQRINDRNVRWWDDGAPLVRPDCYGEPLEVVNHKGELDLFMRIEVYAILRKVHEIYHDDFLRLGYGWSV